MRSKQRHCRRGAEGLKTFLRYIFLLRDSEPAEYVELQTSDGAQLITSDSKILMVRA